jgi:hypothetical protein
MARVLLVAALALLAQGSLVVLLNSTARCLDGSAPAMAVRLASGSGGTASRQWVLDFEGGGWCTSWEECVERSKGARGSSRGWAAERAKGEGLLSRHFARFSSARLLYCDGASFLGTAGPVSRGGTTLHFAGHAVALALVRHLISDFGLAWASDVLVTGCSAGGLAALALADTLRALLPDVPRFKVAVRALYVCFFLLLIFSSRCRGCFRTGASTGSGWSGSRRCKRCLAARRKAWRCSRPWRRRRCRCRARTIGGACGM